MNTTPSIKILDRIVSEKIAAGEVIERPLSVIKELVENSLDAGSTIISVDIEEGGAKLIRVIDNGCGMRREDLELATKRFATSKIADFDDLEKITTLGFRGEALPSIGAVSCMELTSRTGDTYFGHRITIEGGITGEVKEAASEVGTTVCVRKLFYNTPARLKFMKSPVQEAAQISHYISKMALAYRPVHFKMKQEGRSILSFPSQLTLKDCLARVWKLEEGKDLEPFDFTSGSLNVKGYLCHPRITRGNRTEIYTFVNRRLIKNSLLNQAIQEGYSHFLPEKRFPLVLLFLETPGETIDVNVHPAKLEIRFLESAKVFKCVRDTVSKQVKELNVHAYSIGDRIPFFQKEVKTHNAPQTCETPLLYDRYTGEVMQVEEKSPPFVAEKAGSVAHFNRGAKINFSPMMQLAETFIIGEMNGELWIVDQHAAHERIIYERLLATKVSAVTSQELLFPEVIEFSPAESLILEAHLKQFNDMGFFIEHFGGSSFVVRGLPQFLKSCNTGEIITDILCDLSGEKCSQSEDLYEKMRKVVACRGSVKAGQKLTNVEIDSLIYDLLETNDPYHCPHGRPTLVRLGLRELEKLFKRT